MIRSVVVAPIAKFAVADAAAAYQATRPGYGPYFLDCFSHTVYRLTEMPESSPLILPGVRRALFRAPFPFCVLYKVTTEAIVVVDVLPTAADPTRWLRHLIHQSTPPQ